MPRPITPEGQAKRDALKERRKLREQERIANGTRVPDELVRAGILKPDQCKRLAKGRKRNLLLKKLAERGVYIDPDQRLTRAEIFALCRANGIPTDQNIKNTGGELQCRNTAILGGDVCVKHGGSKEEVLERARENFRQLLPDALTRAKKLLKSSNQHGAVVSLIKYIADANMVKPPETMNSQQNGGGLVGLDYSKLDTAELVQLIGFLRKMQNESRIINVSANPDSGQNVDSTQDSGMRTILIPEETTA